MCLKIVSQQLLNGNCYAKKSIGKQELPQLSLRPRLGMLFTSAYCGVSSSFNLTYHSS